MKWGGGQNAKTTHNHSEMVMELADIARRDFVIIKSSGKMERRERENASL